MKKFLVILLVALMGLTLAFVGCKTTTETTAAAAETTAAAAETTAAPETTAAAAETTAAPETTATAAGEVKPFTVDDIPEIKNKADLTMMVETGSVFDKLQPSIDKFSQKTGVKINIERVASPVVYSKENVELVSGTGIYDLVYVETAWTDEWAQYLVPVLDLAKQYESVDAFNASIATQAPAILSTAKTDGALMVVPFYTYQTGMFIRQDVFDDATEQANFKAKYGYDLKPATTPQQLLDQATFFTRKKGEMLKGKALEKDVYGMAMQASAYQANDEFSTYLWGNGGDYVDVKKDDTGKVIEFDITKKNNDIMVQTMKEYVARVKTSSPGVLTANFDFVVASLANGDSLITGMMYSNCFAWNADELKKGAGKTDPDAKLGEYAPIGGKGYTGAWSFGVAKASKNQEAAYWMLRYLSSQEAQTVVMKDAGQVSTRLDVIEDPYWKTAENAYPFGILADYLKGCYSDQAYAKWIENEYYFNSKAGGKVTEMHMNTLSKGFSGELSPEDCIASINKQMVELIGKFDTVPIKVEE
jgi:multiple sugar transport system substrate-binding protein